MGRPKKGVARTTFKFNRGKSGRMVSRTSTFKLGNKVFRSTTKT